MGDPGEMTEFANDDAVFCALNITSSAPGNSGIASRVVVVVAILFLCNLGGANAATQPMLIRHMVRRRKERCILLQLIEDEVYYEFPPSFQCLLASPQ